MQFLDTLLDAAQAEARARAPRIEPDAIVAHGYVDVIRVAADADRNRPRVRVPHAVGQRFLDRAIDAGQELIGQRVEVAEDVEPDVDAVALREVTHVPFEGGLQAEIVEHAGAKAEREIADGTEHLIDELS